MALKFQPRAGQVVRCDFRGMIEPEMIKIRDVVVLARHKHNSRLVSVIPLSTTAPKPPQPYHHLLSKDPSPDGTNMHDVWAKCDMVYTVSTERLEMHYTRTRRGDRESEKVFLPTVDFEAIKKCVAIALGLPHNGQ